MLVKDIKWERRTINTDVAFLLDPSGVEWRALRWRDSGSAPPAVDYDLESMSSSECRDRYYSDIDLFTFATLIAPMTQVTDVGNDDTARRAREGKDAS